MSDNPLQTNPARTERIRLRAYHLWQQDGGPHGRDAEYWERAEELIGMQDSAGAGLLPNPQTLNEPIPGVIVEEAQIQENYGEFPDRSADQGDWRQTPMTKEQLRAWEQGRDQPTRGDAP